MATPAFQGLLFGSTDRDARSDPPDQPPFFGDLHLDDVVRSVDRAGGRGPIAAVFYEPLRTVDAIGYRHDVFRDLEDPQTLAAVRAFGGRMDVVRRRLDGSAKANYATDRERWLVAAAEAFGTAARELSDQLEAPRLRSTALTAFREYLASYVGSDAFKGLLSDAGRVKAAVSDVRYRLRIQGLKVVVSRFEPGPDYSGEVLETFERFRQDAARTPYAWQFDQNADMNHVEAAILERVERLEPGPFRELHAFAARHASFLDPTIERFDREARFFLAWIDFMARVRGHSELRFCYPDVGDRSRRFEAVRVFDVALAASLVGENRAVVPNDLVLDGDERVVLVSGPNQGGKTTFARAIGQIHHLARIGVPVPGERVCLPLVDRIFTHFERQEQVDDLTSKLEEELGRIHAILAEATPASLIIMNESFTATTVADQLFIGRQVLRRILDRGPICLIVTFVDELAAFDPAIVSMVATVDPANEARRTFEIVRHPPTGLAFAMAIAEKHRLTYQAVKRRLAR